MLRRQVITQERSPNNTHLALHAATCALLVRSASFGRVRAAVLQDNFTSHATAQNEKIEEEEIGAGREEGRGDNGGKSPDKNYAVLFGSIIPPLTSPLKTNDTCELKIVKDNKK
ncbi:hypothetical protein RRG08_010423 [Elysia crispata]|uniref:Uncharacterized protein n=1 Tax=Elysia crispata TaxID=231223 RepID=A0AAE0YT08_9GAST|nr:hypothetical protein RRG08_010423 [Elysia crispata]